MLHRTLVKHITEYFDTNSNTFNKL